MDNLITSRKVLWHLITAPFKGLLFIFVLPILGWVALLLLLSTAARNTVRQLTRALDKRPVS